MTLPVRVAAALGALALLAGCALPNPFARKADGDNPPAAAPVATAPVQAPKPAAPPTEVKDLFPPSDWQANFRFDDKTLSHEKLVRDGARVVVTYNGPVYVTWFLTDQGLLRTDPRNKENPVLLRYLPPRLEDNLYWKQASGTETVWFRLRWQDPCPATVTTPAHCWELTVLNRGEKTTFVFATGLGPIGARAENFRNPAASFVKELVDAKPDRLVADERKRLADQGGKLEQAEQPAPPEPVTAEEFGAAEVRARDKP